MMPVVAMLIVFVLFKILEWWAGRDYHKRDNNHY